MEFQEFADILAHELSPSRAITTPQYLRGRDEKLKDIKQALAVPGRQVFIYGLRGVGKTSLAMTSALQYQSSSNDPVLVLCSETDTFTSIIRSIVEQALPTDPAQIKTSTRYSASANLAGFGFSAERYIETGSVPEPQNLNDAISLIDFASQVHSSKPVFIIDEFEAVIDTASHSMFARFLKGIADRQIAAKFIFCGIAETVEEIFVSHGSAHRYLHTANLERLSWEAREEIIVNAANAVSLNIDRSTRIRIASISDGFPYFVHEVTSKLLWEIFDSGYHTGATSTVQNFEMALSRSIEGIELEFRGPYDRAVQKYNVDGECILWALADTHELKRNLQQIHKSYVRICDELGYEKLERNQLSARLSNFRRGAFSEIVLSDRKAWYEFSQKMMRGYARLRAARSGIHLDADHPLG